MKSSLQYAIVAGLSALLFVPLIVSDSMFFPFITGKAFAFRIIVEILFAAWLILAFFHKEYRPKYSHILGAFAAFIGVITLADLLGENPAKSIWSNFERMEGLVAHLHFFAYFIVAISVLKTERLWKWFFHVSLVAASIMAFYGLSQAFGDARVHQGGTRVDGQLGNAAYMAVYMLFHFFIALYYFAREKKNLILKYIYGALMLLFFTVMYQTETRGAMVGFFGGVGLIMVLVALFERERPNLRKIAIGGLVGIVALVGLFVLMKDSDFVRNNTTLNRFAKISLEENTTKSRFMIWGMSWEGFKERPILGWGQDNFIYVFVKHYDPGMHSQEPWFDRSHNVFFDWMIAGGIAGILAYLSMFITTLYYIWFRKRSPFSLMERTMLTGLLGAYFVQNLFVFDNLASYMIFFAVIGYVHVSSTQNEEEGVVAAVSKKTSKGSKGKQKEEATAFDMHTAIIFVTVVVIFTGYVIYAVNIKNIAGNHALLDMLTSQVTLNKDGQPVATPEKGLKYIDEALTLGMIGRSETREQIVQIAMRLNQQGIDQGLLQEYFTRAEEEMLKAIEEDPENSRAVFFLATLYANFGKHNKAIEQFEKAIEQSPSRQMYIIELARVYLNKGLYDAALPLFKLAFELDTDYKDARVYYITSLMLNGDIETAEQLIAEYDDALEEGGKKTKIAESYQILSTYVFIGQLEKPKAILRYLIAEGNTQKDMYLLLANIYVQQGNVREAIAVIEDLMQKKKKFIPEGQYYIDQIKKSTGNSDI